MAQETEALPYRYLIRKATESALSGLPNGPEPQPARSASRIPGWRRVAPYPGYLTLRTVALQRERTPDGGALRLIRYLTLRTVALLSAARANRMAARCALSAT